MKRWCLVLLMGCSSSEPASAPVDGAAPADANATDAAVVVDTAAGPVVDSAAPDTTPVDSAVDSAAPADTVDAADSADAAPPVMPVDCFADKFGPSSGTLVDFFYQRQVDTCESSKCSDFMMFDPKLCELTLQVADEPFKATLSAEHCDLLKRWLTSELLIRHLRDTVTCYGAMIPGSFESTQITLSDGTANKKTFMCKDEPFSSHRACLAGFRAEYFPGK